MKQKLKYIIGVVLFIAVPHLCFAQYFQRLYDVDSSQDWGVNIFLQLDGNYFVKGAFFSDLRNWALFTMQITADGNTALSRQTLQYDTANLYSGNPGETKALAGGGYIAPLTIQTPDPITGYVHSAAGFIKYNETGDTIFKKTYTDTSIYFEGITACAIMPDGGYIGGGARALNIPSYYPGLIIRTDSVGDTLWTHTYQLTDTQAVQVNNVIPLADGRIVVGAMSTYQVTLGPPDYYTYNHNSPWFMVLDSMGNIIKDTVYGSAYGGGGALYKDMGSGYFHIGELDMLYTGNPSDYENFPDYFARLDTNFNVEWKVTFSIDATVGHRAQWTAIQLKDSSYIVTGDAGGLEYTPGWAAKISKNGILLWSNTYISEPTQNAYFRAVAEKPDGGLVFTGATYNDTCPSWHDHLDMWLVSTDSNGYIPPGTGVTVSPVAAKEAVKIYPNPTSGNFTISTSASLTGGEVLVYNVAGLYVATYKVKPGANNFQLPAGIGAGIYICKYIPGDGNDVPAVVRLVYAP